MTIEKIVAVAKARGLSRTGGQANRGITVTYPLNSFLTLLSPISGVSSNYFVRCPVAEADKKKVAFVWFRSSGTSKTTLFRGRETFH